MLCFAAPQSTATRDKQHQIESALREDKICAAKLKSFALSDNGLVNGKCLHIDIEIHGYMLELIKFNSINV